MTVLHWLGFATGLGLIVGTMGSVVSTTVVPRGTHSRIVAVTARALDLPFRTVADRVDDWRLRDHLRAYQGPSFVLVILAVWLLLLLSAYALLIWPFTDDLGDALRISGSSLFTLGLASNPAPAPTTIAYGAAASGLIVIALQIGYLPALYAAFNRREVLVTVLAGTAGTPAWGPEILARHAIFDSLELMPRVYDRWTEWGADVAESHLGYPVLLYFRSPSPDRSWVVSLLAVLDAAALHLAFCPVTAPGEARQLMSVGIATFRDLATRLGIADPTPVHERTLQLQRHDVELAFTRLQSAGFRAEDGLDEAWPRFRGWRVNYEAEAYGIARNVDAVPAVWSGPRYHAGHQIAPATEERLRPPDDHRLLVEVEEIRRTGELRREARRDGTDARDPLEAELEGAEPDPS